MTALDFHQLALQLASANEDEQAAALRRLYALDEDAVDPLIDVFYAGVTEAVGAAIIAVLAAIGGPDALLALRNIYQYEERLALRRAAAQGLLHNPHNLAPDEHAQLTRFLDDQKWVSSS